MQPISVLNKPPLDNVKIVAFMKSMGTDWVGRNTLRSTLTDTHAFSDDRLTKLLGSLVNAQVLLEKKEPIKISCATRMQTYYKIAE